MKIAVASAPELVLDYLVAKLEFGVPPTITPDGYVSVGYDERFRYSPSTDWAQGGPIINRMLEGHFFLVENGGDRCHVVYSKTPHDNAHGMGDTILVAAMRCLVAIELGAEVEVEFTDALFRVTFSHSVGEAS